MAKIWQKPAKIDKTSIDRFPELHPLVAQLLFNRGLTDQKGVDEFLHPDYSQDVHDPYLFKDMKKACDRIFQAIKDNEKITVYGDYDADGVSASVILHTTLEKLGANTATYIPHREKEGYGLNKSAVEEMSGDGTKLVITCDCGISNTEEVDLARERGLDVIITDHHAIPENLPRAFAIIHAQVEGETYPFKYLAGGGVAFKLAQGLLRHDKCQFDEKQKETWEKWLLDMVAVSTVADMVTLLGENRTLAKYGLIVLKKTVRLGMKKLLEVANIEPKKIDARSIGFAIAPRINAAGRMDHANLAYYLMIEEDVEKAEELAKQLNQSNLDRQRITEQVVKEAESMEIDENDKLLTFFKEDWPAGLTGLVASRLMKKFSRPCIVMTKTDEFIIGSGRSIDEFNITKALNESPELLERFGGHPQAAGFAMKPENMDKLISRLKQSAADQMEGVELTDKLEIEVELDFADISWDLVDMVEKFKPFGMDNEEPLILSENVKVASLRKVGNDQKHLKMTFQKNDKIVPAIAFGMGDRDLALGDNVDIVYNLSINQWNGNREIQLMIRDIKKHDS